MDSTEGDLRRGLTAVTAEAWHLFAVPRPASHQACTACCLTPGEDRAFFTRDARALGADWLDAWLCAAFDPPIAPDLARYLLPLVLQALHDDADFTFGTEVALRRFRTGDGGFWTGPERDLILRWRSALIEELRGGGVYALDEILCMFCSDGHPPAPMLRQLETWPATDLVDRLWRDWDNGRSFRQLGHWSDRDVPPAWAAEVTAWYSGPVVLQRIHDAICDETARPEVFAKADALLLCTGNI